MGQHCSRLWLVTRRRQAESFISDFKPILNKFSQGKSDSIVCGDFNINLLKIQERNKYAEFLDMFLNNGYLPQISLPTRFSKKNATLIDQIFCKTTDVATDIFSGIIISQTSDHLPTFSSLNLLNTKKSTTPKFIKIQVNTPKAHQKFCTAVANLDLSYKLDHSPNTDPNYNYNILCEALQRKKDEYLPTKTVKFHKHKHKKSPWITSSIIKSIQTRDKLYAKLLTQNRESIAYHEMKTKLRGCNTILKKNLRIAKQSYFQNILQKCQSDIKKTWNAINTIINKNAKRKDFPSKFLVNNIEMNNKTEISNKFNEYFATIGPKLASEITQAKNV